MKYQSNNSTDLSDFEQTSIPSIPRHRSSFSKKQQIKVVCRVRPPLQNDQCAKFKINKNNNQITIFDHIKNSQKIFSFNQICDWSQSQYDFIDLVCKPVIKNLQDQGKGSLIFSYGVTNSGKTYTILGNDENPGILPYIIRNLKQETKIYAFQIYNDEFLDLNTNQKINLKDHGSYYDFVNFKPQVIHQQNMNEILSTYMKNRTQTQSNINPYSSRSHAIFRIQSQGTIIGVVDLAGSQRMNKALGSVEQTSNINKSLLSLGKCIQAMKERSSNPKIVIPYRQSKLTKILYQFLCEEDYGITMIANLSLSANVFHESMKVLQYAALAKEIKPDRSKSPLSHVVSKSKKKPHHTDFKNLNASILKNTKQKVSQLKLKSVCKHEKKQTNSNQKFMKDIELKKFKKFLTDKQQSQQQNQDNIDEQEHKLRIKVLNQELIKENKKEFFNKIKQKINASQQQFDQYFDSNFEREKQETDKAFQELKILKYTSPVINKKYTIYMDNQNEEQQVQVQKVQIKIQQIQNLEKAQQIVQRIQHSEKKMRNLIQEKQLRDKIRKQIQQQLLFLYEKEKIEKSCQVGTMVGDSLKKLYQKDQQQNCIQFPKNFQQAVTPSKGINHNIFVKSQCQQKQLKNSQFGIMNYIKTPKSIMKTGMKKYSSIKNKIAQIFSSKKDKPNQMKQKQLQNQQQKIVKLNKI